MIQKFIRFKITSAAFFASLTLVLSGWLWAYFSLRNLPPPYILRFVSNLGVTQLGDLQDIAAAGAVAMISVLLNFILAFELETKAKFLAKLLTFSTLTFAALIFIGFAAIISVN
ncbi:MAG: hypothetical protein HYT13_01600 [Candidatus Liptonbacteria bacterium]|nr:hypothetical protein [Candidatus Liptonbacteria bacterium]